MPPVLNSVEAQWVQQLETLLTSHKTFNDELRKEPDAAGGVDSGSLGRGHSRKELAQEAEMAKAAKAEADKALSEAKSVS